jgi:hypothetical protein
MESWVASFVCLLIAAVGISFAVGDRVESMSVDPLARILGENDRGRSAADARSPVLCRRHLRCSSGPT